MGGGGNPSVSNKYNWCAHVGTCDGNNHYKWLYHKYICDIISKQT